MAPLPLLLALAAASSPAPAATAPAPAPAPAARSTPAPRADDRVICKTAPAPGSRIPGRVCKTEAEWKEIRAIDSGQRFKREVWN